VSEIPVLGREEGASLNKAVRSGQDNSAIATLIAFRHVEGMGQKFHGSHTEFKERLAPLALDGDWEEQPNGVFKFRCRDRSDVLWSETKGTIWFDWPSPQKDSLSAKITAALGDGVATPLMDSDSQIFVVHGRDRDS
jgi:hypothetical protein